MSPKPKKLRSPFPSEVDLRERVRSLGLWGLDTEWERLRKETWLPEVVELEEQERARRSLERRIRTARIGKFKPMDQFDWSWPRKIDRTAIDDLFRFEFAKEGANVVLMGPNGVGKTMLAQNLTQGALLAGYTARFVTASEMLNDLAAQDGRTALRRRVNRFVRPAVLAIDEVGYLSYGTHHADLMFDIVNRRAAAERATIVTTNKPFQEWADVFPNSAAVVALVDRLVHRSEIVEIDGESFRLKEAKERDAERRRRRASPRHRATTTMSSKRPAPPRPDLRRSPSRSFGWLDARLLHEEWLGALGPEATATLTLLALAADEFGASFYGRETMARVIGVDRRELDRCLARLLELGLVAHRAWSDGHPDGVWQILPVPRR